MPQNYVHERELTFFIIVLILLVINTALMATLQMSTVVLMARLPLDYLLFFLVGNQGNVFVTILQIISLAVTDDDSTTALIYFGVNVVVMILAFVLLMLARRTDVFKYYQVEITQSQKSETLSWTESMALIKKVWPCMAIIILCYGASMAVHPSISTLVVSQYELDKSQWSDKYFTPVCAFLVSELSAVFGRIVSKKIIINANNKLYFIAVAAGRFILLISIGLFLNAKPRTMPVIFGKDWEFALYMFFFGFSQGLLLNICSMSMKSLAPGQQDVALKFVSLTTAICSTAFVANGMIAVKVLSI
ncbi:unnamed protein product [Phyllotreta striolata]|uniref:Equilibrative nucleoside transporter n=1 Tax=Phyllotreta striolata TaxID=444603 RepID=A0A9N9TSY3_PHYSR|nr:unnamed protein product [Phyllotreta striolata]